MRKINHSKVLSFFLILMLLANLFLGMSFTVTATAPIVTTEDATGIEETNATLQGNLTDDDGMNCTTGFEYGLTAGYTNVNITDDEYIYAAGIIDAANKIGKIYKYWKSNMTKITESPEYGNPALNGGFIIALAQDGTYIYAGGSCDAPQNIKRYWKSNLTYKDGTGDYVGAIRTIAIDDTYIYAGGSTTQKVRQYWKSNMTLKANSTDCGGSIYSLADDDTYVYAGLATGGTNVTQFWKSNMTRKASTTSYGGIIEEIAVDSTYLYVAGRTTKKVYQYWLNNMTYKGQTASCGADIYGLTQDDTYIYIGTTKIHQYRKSDLTLKAETTISLGYCGQLTQDYSYIYFGSYGNGVTYQHWKSNLTEKGETADYGKNIMAVSTMDTNVTYTWIAEYDYDTNDIYVVGDNSNKINVYQLKDLTKVGESTSDSGEAWQVMGDSTYLYTHVYNSRYVYQFWRDNLTKKADVVTLPTSYYGTVMAHDTDYIYITNSNGAGVFKVFKYSKLTNIKVAESVQYEHNGDTINDIKVDDTYVYIGGWGDKVWQLWKSNLTKKSETISSDIINTIVQDDTYIYYGGYNGIIIQCWKSNMTRKTISGAIGFSRVFDIDDTYIYYGNSNDNKVYQVWKSNLTTKAITSALSSEPYTITNDDAYIYTAGGSTFSQFWKSNLTLKDTSASNGGTIYCLYLPEQENYSTGETFNFNLGIGLSPGTLYHYRAYATNSNGTGYGSDEEFLTKPNAPSSLVATAFNATKINLAWNKGTGANNTMVRQKTGDYPISITDGDLVYNSTGTSTSNSSLTPGMLYYYRAWSYAKWNASQQWSDSYSSSYALTKPEAPTNSTYVINGTGMNINLSWDIGIGANRTIVLVSLTNMPTNYTDGTVIYNGTGNYTIYNFTLGNPYYFKAWSYKNWSNPSLFQYSDTGIIFEIGGLLINCYDENTNADVTFDVKISNQAGTDVYENNGCTNTHSVNASLCPLGTNIQVIVSATGYQQRIRTIDLQPDVFYLLNVYLPPITTPGNGTENCELRAYIDSITITNPDIDTVVTLTYTLEDIISVEIYNASLYGTYGGWIFVASDKYSFTSTSVTINETVMDANTTMARVSYYYNFCTGGIASALYNIRVVETITTEYTSYDKGVEDAFVIVKRYINSTGLFVEVSSVYTDANGYINLYLIPDAHYKVFINKTGYVGTIGDYIPSPPNVYGQTAEKTFRIVLIETGGSIIIPETLFTNITYSFYPTDVRHTGAFKFWYNISSSDGKIQWYRMVVQYYNESTGIWTLLDSQNKTGDYGGSINYTTPNVSGKYEFQCFFKKTGFDEYEFGQTGSLVQFIYFIRQALASFPDYAWFIVTIILMIIGMGFFMRYFGSGIVTGYIGLGIFAIMLLLKDISVPMGVGNPISGWLIWAITFMIYTMGVFLYSRI